MANPAYGFGVGDVARIGRSVRATEGADEAPTRKRAKYPVGVGGSPIKPFVLLTDMKPYPDANYTFDDMYPLKRNIDNTTYVAAERSPNRRRNFHCWASQMDVLTDDTANGEYVYVVRFTDDAPTTLQWQLRRGSQHSQILRNEASGSLRAPTATQLLAAMQPMAYWADNVEVFGYGDYYPVGDNQVYYYRKSWHIKFSSAVPKVMNTGRHVQSQTSIPPDYTHDISTETGYVSPYFAVVDATSKQGSRYIDHFQDFFWPNGKLVQIFSGSPSQEQLKSGAMCWATKVKGRWFIPGNECWTYTP